MPIRRTQQHEIQEGSHDQRADQPGAHSNWLQPQPQRSCHHILPHPIGTLTPVFFANAIASGYPASTCLATPIPGSFVSTRSMRSAISFVPSATVTCPACCEYPIPTPPPL